MANQKSGTVKWFNNDKGFGFIQIDGTEKDMFVHHSQINNSGYGRVTLNDGQKVTFEIGDGLKGEQAINVNIVS